MATAQKSQEDRFLAFANLFKGYMGVMSIITAALAPSLTAMNLVPTYASQRKPLAAVAGVLGFLLVAWLFYVRMTIALGSIKRRTRVFFNLCPIVLHFGGDNLLCRLLQYARYIRKGSRSATRHTQPSSRRMEQRARCAKVRATATALFGYVPLL